MITYQVKVVKYLGGFVHLSHGDQDFIINVLLERSHIKPYSGLKGRVHLQYSSRGRISVSRNTFDHFLLFFNQLHSLHFIQFNFLSLSFTILDVRLSRSSVLMMSLRCSLISLSLDILSAELPVKDHVKF